MNILELIKNNLRTLLFVIGGAAAGLAYYYFVGCSTGSCPITSSPVTSMLYMALIAWLLSGVFSNSCNGGCGR